MYKEEWSIDRSVLDAYISRRPPTILSGGRETFILTDFGNLWLYRHVLQTEDVGCAS